MELGQAIDLKDKNGKDIHIGDNIILPYWWDTVTDTTEYDIPARIIWSNFAVMVVNESGETKFFSIYCNNPEQLEVIGD